MGSCLGRELVTLENEDLENAISIGKNRPLLQDKIKWKSEHPLTESQIRAKRKEFWETAPAFDGRTEIWDALRAAAAQVEHGDFALAQAILDGANISLPDGTLRESYDELGNRYQIPLYCLSFPTNMAEEHSYSNAVSSERASSNSTSGSAEITVAIVRLSSSGEDFRFPVNVYDTILSLKKLLYDLNPDAGCPKQQRWFFGGRLLENKARFKDCRIPLGFVIQVAVPLKRRASGLVATTIDAQTSIQQRQHQSEGNPQSDDVAQESVNA